MKHLTFLFVLSLVFGCTSTEHSKQSISELEVAGIKLVEVVKAEAGKTVIPYRKYELANGLVLILHEDHSDPLVHVDITYHVGSGREEAGKSGFAHFFEHMMFQGSDNVADEQHFKLVTEAGGTMNGSTNTDRTNYYQTVPANQLEKMLWLEADRMGFLVDSVTQKKFEVQRETVKNERGQNYDNRPYGRFREQVSAALYPTGHPYSWPTIGYMEDLNRANVNDLKKFFLNWYGPNNATVTIGGDLDLQSTLELVVKYFGSIPKGPKIKMPEKTLVTLASDRYISMEDNVHLPLVYMSYPTVSARHNDEAPLDLLAQILGGGKTSLLYKNLVKNQFAVQASVNHPCAELACSFNMLALPHPASGKTLTDLEKIMRETLLEFETRGVEPDDLEKAKAQMEARFIFGLQSVRGKVSQLAANQTYTGNPNYIEQDIARYANVTKKDVDRVFLQYIKGHNAVIMSVVPTGKIGAVTHKDNFAPIQRKLAAESTTSSSDLDLRKAKDNFDRSRMPVAGINAAVDVPEIWQRNTKNGIKILGSLSTETPTTSLLIKVPAGHYYEAKIKAGTANLVASLLNESTARKSTEEMSKALQLLGSSISIYSNNQFINVSVNSLTKNIDETMELLKEKLLHPAFLESDFIRIQKNTIQGIVNSKKNASYLARTAYNQLLNGDDIAATPINGTENSVSALTLEDVKSFYSSFVKPEGTQLIVVSDRTEQQLSSALSVLNNWKGSGPELTLKIVKSQSKKGIIYLVNKNKAPQSSIRIGKRGLKQDITGEFYRTYLMNFPLGGAFNSRINLNLREDKGYTYGARSFFWGNKLTGGYAVTAEVRANVTDKAIIEIVKEIKNYNKDGITDSELVFMKNSINQRDALKYETPSAKLDFLGQILEHDLSPKFVEEQTQIVRDITASEINQLAKKHLNLNEMLLVVVGDAKILKPQLEALGYEVVDYSI